MSCARLSQTPDALAACLYAADRGSMAPLEQHLSHWCLCWAVEFGSFLLRNNSTLPPSVAVLRSWQASPGVGGNLAVVHVAGCTWTGWQLSHGLGGRHPWNMQLLGIVTPLRCGSPQAQS